MRLWILKAWPALIPIVLYVGWLLWKRRKAAKAGEELPTFFSGPWLLTLSSAFIIATICLFALGLSAENNAGVSYTPKRFIDGQLIDGRLE
jgi:hypothetical protein